jgi:hypothetical protein
MGGHLLLARGAGLEMLSHFLGLWRCEFPIEIAIELCGWPLARHPLLLQHGL